VLKKKAFKRRWRGKYAPRSEKEGQQGLREASGRIGQEKKRPNRVSDGFDLLKDGPKQLKKEIKEVGDN
jgi:hypothetical protein